MKLLLFVRVRKIRKKFLQWIPSVKFAEQIIVTDGIRKTNYLDLGKFLPLNLEILYTKVKLALSFNRYLSVIWNNKNFFQHFLYKSKRTGFKLLVILKRNIFFEKLSRWTTHNHGWWFIKHILKQFVPPHSRRNSSIMTFGVWGRKFSFKMHV